MKSIIRIIYIVGLFYFFQQASIAQSLSNYEQKRYDLASAAIKSMMETDASLSIAIALAADKYRSDLSNETRDDKYIEMDFAESLLQALGTGASFMGVDTWKDYYLKQSVSIIYQDWKKKKAALDIIRTKDDIIREQLRKAPPSAVKGTTSDLKMRIKKDYESWAIKRTYEKTETQKERLYRLGIAVFDSLCMKHCQDIIYASEYAKFIPEEYDADSESYAIRFVFGNKESGKKEMKGEWLMPVEFASAGSDGGFSLTLTKAQVVNGFVVPLEMICTAASIVNHQRVTHESKLVFDRDPSATDFQVCFNEENILLDINASEALLDHCFKLDTYWAERKEIINELLALFQTIVLRFNKLKTDHDALIKYANSNGWATYDIGSVENCFKKDADRDVYDIIKVTIDHYEDLSRLKTALENNTAHWSSLLIKWEKSLDLAEETMFIGAQDAFNRYINAKYDRLLNANIIGTINKIAFDDGTIVFRAKVENSSSLLGSRKTIKGNFQKSVLTSKPLGKQLRYNGYYEVLNSPDNTMCLVRKTKGTIYLIVGAEVFKLSESVQSALLEHVGF